MKTFHIITLFPEYFSGFLASSLMGKAIEKGLFQVNLVQLRDFAQNKHNNVDDKVFGGGAGMLLQIEPIDLALKSLPAGGGHRMITDPRGNLFTSKRAQELANMPGDITLVCGNYEGVDYRVNEHLIDEEVSIGEYILNGGETAAVVLIEAMARFIPGVIGKSQSHQIESFDSTGLLEYPQYSRPEEYNGWKVPSVLLSGNHAEIARWREAKREELSGKRKQV